MNKGSSKYTNIYEVVVSSNYFLYVFIGGRRIGKTYSMLSNCLFNNERIIYLRRTGEQLENSCTEIANPYKAININEGTNVHIDQVKKACLIYNEKEDGKDIVGYGMALSTFGNLRGADFSDVEYIIFDEFINTSPINSLKKESWLLFNLIATVNNTREIEGKKPVKVVLISNAETIDDDIIRSLSLADKIQIMKETNKSVYTDDERGLYLALLENKQVRDLMSETALYKLTKGTTFYDMALNNEFTRDYFGDVGKLDYRELKPVCSYDKFFFYEHKSKELLFVSYRKANCPAYDERSIKVFKRQFGFKILWYMEAGLCLYADYNIKLSVKEIFKNG